MNRRFRVLAALLALLGLSAYFAEGLVASLCMPEMDVSGPEAVVPAGSGSHAGMHQPPGESPHGPEHSRPDAPGCPPGMAGPGSSCVAVSLPATTDVVRSAPTVREGSFPSLDRSPGLILVAAHFRPPRA